MYPPLRQAEWIKFIGLLITSENFCTLKIQKKFGDAFYPRTLTHWLKPLIHHSYSYGSKYGGRVVVNSCPHYTDLCNIIIIYSLIV